MTNFLPLPSALDLTNPVLFGANLGARAGFVIGNNIVNKKPLGTGVGEALSQPSTPIILNNPPPKETGPFGDFKIGFIEKNVIIIGVFALGGLAIWRAIKR